MAHSQWAEGYPAITGSSTLRCTPRYQALARLDSSLRRQLQLQLTQLPGAGGSLADHLMCESSGSLHRT